MQEIIYNLSDLADDRRPFNVLSAGISFCDGTYRMERKAEDFFAIEYIYQGKGTLAAAGQVVSPQTGDVFLQL